MKIRRLPIPAALAVLFALLFGFAAPASADSFESLVKGLKTERLYVSSESGGTLAPADRQAVVNALKGDDATIRIAVLKPTALNPAGAKKLYEALGDKGTLIMLDGKGDHIRVASHDGLGDSKINSIVAQQRGASSNLKELLLNLNQGFDKAIKDKKAGAATGAYVLLGILVFVIAGVVGLVLLSRKRRREREAKQMAELKENVDEDVTRLGEDITGLNLNVMDSGLDPATRDDYRRAMDSYDQAKAAVDSAQKPDDMRKVTTALEDGRFFMTAVRARLDGRPVPERRAPCFFNPQHGPSLQDVSWAPAGGAPRSVPACAADAQRVLSGQDPESRLVSVGGNRRPYWEAGPMYAPYAGGYYSGFGGGDMLGGILIGTALGSMFGGGWGGGGYDAGYEAGNDGGWGGDGGGDGGIDFGGGDFGDFGGGDFGGGDW